MFDLALFRILYFGLSLLFMILWHGRIWTTDHDNLWQVDEGVQPDGWTVHLMNGNGRQTMIICPRWTEVEDGQRQAVYLMDVLRRWTIRNIKNVDEG